MIPATSSGAAPTVGSALPARYFPPSIFDVSDDSNHSAMTQSGRASAASGASLATGIASSAASSIASAHVGSGSDSSRTAGMRVPRLPIGVAAGEASHRLASISAAIEEAVSSAVDNVRAACVSPTVRGGVDRPPPGAAATIAQAELQRLRTVSRTLLTKSGPESSSVPGTDFLSAVPAGTTPRLDTGGGVQPLSSMFAEPSPPPFVVSTAPARAPPAPPRAPAARMVTPRGSPSTSKTAALRAIYAAPTLSSANRSSTSGSASARMTGTAAARLAAFELQAHRFRQSSGERLSALQHAMFQKLSAQVKAEAEKLLAAELAAVQRAAHTSWSEQLEAAFSRHATEVREWSAKLHDQLALALEKELHSLEQVQAQADAAFFRETAAAAEKEASARMTELVQAAAQQKQAIEQKVRAEVADKEVAAMEALQKEVQEHEQSVREAAFHDLARRVEDKKQSALAEAQQRVASEVEAEVGKMMATWQAEVEAQLRARQHELVQQHEQEAAEQAAQWAADMSLLIEQEKKRLEQENAVKLEAERARFDASRDARLAEVAARADDELTSRKQQLQQAVDEETKRTLAALGEQLQQQCEQALQQEVARLEKEKNAHTAALEAQWQLKTAEELDAMRAQWSASVASLEDTVLARLELRYRQQVAGTAAALKSKLNDVEPECERRMRAAVAAAEHELRAIAWCDDRSVDTDAGEDEEVASEQAAASTRRASLASDAKRLRDFVQSATSSVSKQGTRHVSASLREEASASDGGGSTHANGGRHTSSMVRAVLQAMDAECDSDDDGIATRTTKAARETRGGSTGGHASGNLTSPALRRALLTSTASLQQHIVEMCDAMDDLLGRYKATKYALLQAKASELSRRKQRLLDVSGAPASWQSLSAGHASAVSAPAVAHGTESRAAGSDATAAAQAGFSYYRPAPASVDAFVSMQPTVPALDLSSASLNSIGSDGGAGGVPGSLRRLSADWSTYFSGEGGGAVPFGGVQFAAATRSGATSGGPLPPMPGLMTAAAGAHPNASFASPPRTTYWSVPAPPAPPPASAGFVFRAAPAASVSANPAQAATLSFVHAGGGGPGQPSASTAAMLPAHASWGSTGVGVGGARFSSPPPPPVYQHHGTGVAADGRLYVPVSTPAALSGLMLTGPTAGVPSTVRTASSAAQPRAVAMPLGASW